MAVANGYTFIYSSFTYQFILISFVMGLVIATSGYIVY